MICIHCKKEIKSGEARYTLREPEVYQHYDCHEQWVVGIKEGYKKLDASVARFQTLISVLRRKI